MGGFFKFFKSKFFIISLTAAFLLSIVPGVLFAMGKGAYVREAVEVAAYPFRWCFSKIGEGLAGYSSYFATSSDLRAENERLRAELAECEGKVYDSSLLEEENAYLRSFLGLKTLDRTLTFESVSVIGRESTNYRTVLTLSKGAAYGLAVNMPVITSDGLVGHIIEVGATYSVAVAFTESSESVGAISERSGAAGMVVGTYELRSDGVCRMEYLTADADIRVGDKIMTSGVGSVYPAGLCIGEVTEVAYDETTRTKKALIKPYADIGGTTKLMVITSFSESTVASGQ